MAYIITEECGSCGACEVECPNQAISEGEEIYVIDTAKCTECVGFFEEAQCMEVCPMGAPEPDPDNKETKEELIEKFKKLHPGEEPKLF
jgi:ferredoxin